MVIENININEKIKKIRISLKKLICLSKSSWKKCSIIIVVSASKLGTL